MKDNDTMINSMAKEFYMTKINLSIKENLKRDVKVDKGFVNDQMEQYTKECEKIISLMA